MQNNIKSLRQQKWLSQEELALILGVSRQTVYAIEIWKYDPSLPLAFKLAHVFEKTLEEIFIYENNPDE